jgi:putative transposase
MAYIELNMVRAGAVKHPKDWEFCGYNEILDPPRRYRLIDRTALLSSCGITDPDEFRTYYEEFGCAHFAARHLTSRKFMDQ